MKKEVILLIVLIALLLSFSKLVKNKRKGMFTPKDAQDAINYISDLKGRERAQLIEKMLRLETAHFTSEQYKRTGSAGMEEGKWYNLPPHDVLTFNDPVKGLRPFIVWHSVKDFVKYLSDYIDRNGGNFARWNTTDAKGQKEYATRVNSVTPKFT